MSKLQAAYDREFQRKALAHDPHNIRLQFNEQIFLVAEENGEHPNFGGHVVAMAADQQYGLYATEAWSRLTESQKEELSKQVFDTCMQDLRGGRTIGSIRSAMDVVINRTIQSLVETMLPQFLTSVHDRLNESWDASVNKVVNLSIEKIISKVKAEFFK